MEIKAQSKNFLCINSILQYNNFSMSTGLTNDKSKDKIQSFHSSALFSSPMTSLQVESQNTSLKETKDARIKHI